MNAESTKLYQSALLVIAIVGVVAIYMPTRDAELAHKQAMACPEPMPGERLVWTLQKSADGGPDENVCHYEQKLAYGDGR